MNRARMRWAALASAGAAAVAVTAAGLSGGAAASTAGTTLVLTSEPATTSTLFHPCLACVEFSKPKGAHIGGEEIDAGSLWRGSTKVGHYAIESLGMTPFTSAHPGELLLTAVIVINGSQIVAQSLEEPPDNSGTAAIAGGTGAYRDAHGIVQYSDNADGSTTLRVSLDD